MENDKKLPVLTDLGLRKRITEAQELIDRCPQAAGLVKKLLKDLVQERDARLTFQQGGKSGPKPKAPRMPQPGTPAHDALQQLARMGVQL